MFNNKLMYLIALVLGDEERVCDYGIFLSREDVDFLRIWAGNVETDGLSYIILPQLLAKFILGKPCAKEVLVQTSDNSPLNTIF